jgi:hypothetical protein
MCDAILRTYVCPGIYTLAKQVIESYLSCRKVNKQVLKGQLPVRRNLGLRSFQNTHMDYTKLSLVSSLKYLLIIVDHLTNWVEAAPLLSATADGVVKVLLDNIIY